MSQKPMVYAELARQAHVRQQGPLDPAEHRLERRRLRRPASACRSASTRALLDAALAGELDDVETEIHPILGLAMPKSAPGVDSRILNPRNTWQDKAAYDAAATKLRDMFRTNYDNQGYAKLGIPNVM